MANNRHGSGKSPYTSLGNDLAGQQHQMEMLPSDVAKTYNGWLKDIRLPLGERNSCQDRKPGCWVRMFFDSRVVEAMWGNVWFKLAANPADLLQTYGTEDSMRNTKIRLKLSVHAVSVRQSIARIEGDVNHEFTHREYDKTPVKCFADIIYGISSGVLPS